MNPRRVLIVNVRSLLMESVVGLLDSIGNGNFDVVSTIVDNLPDLIREVRLIKPDVIVLDEVTSLTKPAALIASLMSARNIRIIALNSRTSKMDIYDRCEFTITVPGQLIEALKLEQTQSALQRRWHVAKED